MLARVSLAALAILLVTAVARAQTPATEAEDTDTATWRPAGETPVLEARRTSTAADNDSTAGSDTAAGSGGYGTVLGFASNKDRSMSMIHFPEIRKGDENFEGYMGHDTFGIEGRKLVRIFPVYNRGDTNVNPTGGRRKLFYGLYPGEAMWQLRVEKSEMLNAP